MDRSRRLFLKKGAAAACGVLWGQSLPRTSSAAAKANPYQGLKSDLYLGPADVLTKVVDKDVFTEGPAVDREGFVFFTNIPVAKILRWDPRAKSLSLFRPDSNNANGLCFDPSGRLLACEGGAGRVTRMDRKSGQTQVLADSFNGFPLAPPNDLCLDAKGRVYFTSRPGTIDPAKGNVNAVYRIDTDGTLDPILRWPDVHMPNGIVTSPDDKLLYFVEAHPDADHHRDIRAYDIQSDGRISNGRILINFYPGRSGDGMCIDAEGNLYVAAGLHRTRNTSETLDTRPGIHVISPAGKLLAFRETPEDTVTNCTFGGSDLRTLYVTCGSFLLSVRTETPGKASYRPQA